MSKTTWQFMIWMWVAWFIGTSILAIVTDTFNIGPIVYAGLFSLYLRKYKQLYPKTKAGESVSEQQRSVAEDPKVP